MIGTMCGKMNASICLKPYSVKIVKIESGALYLVFAVLHTQYFLDFLRTKAVGSTQACSFLSNIKIKDQNWLPLSVVIYIKQYIYLIKCLCDDSCLIREQRENLHYS